MFTQPVGLVLLALAAVALPPMNPLPRRMAWLGSDRLGAAPVATRSWTPRLPAGWRWRSRDADRAELSRVVAAITDEYAAGATAASALSSSAVNGERFREPLLHAARQAAVGDDVADALAADPELARLGIACSVASNAGTSLTAVLRGLRADLDADQEVHRAVRSTLAGPRASAFLLALLPVVGLAMGAGMGANPWQVLVHTAPGLISLAVGVLLDIAGVLWSLALARGALP